MPNVSIKSNIDQVFKNVIFISKNIKSKVIKLSINDTVRVSSTATSRLIKAEGYNMSVPKIGKTLTKNFASETNLKAKITSNSKRVNLKEFSPLRYGKKQIIKRVRGKINLVSGGGISVKVKNGRKKIPHAFFMKGLVVIRARHAKEKNGLSIKTKKQVKFKGGFELYKDDIKLLTGPSVSKAFSSEKVINNLRLKTAEHLPKRLAHHLKRLTQ